MLARCPTCFVSTPSTSFDGVCQISNLVHKGGGLGFRHWANATDHFGLLAMGLWAPRLSRR